MYRRHYVIYFDEDNNLIHTTPRQWAMANQGLFPNYSFLYNNIPVTETINNYLIQHGFQRIESETRVILINY
ncbi:hypothetical protein [Corallibacter sp.]|uniref:hypothetical protein n=1 Tax=Corallibacter sp. TaxID=2038084 RepID=UPI003AB3694C